MKKLLKKDKTLRTIIKKLGIKYFILKSLIQNNNLFKLIRLKAFLVLQKTCPKTSIVNRCVYSNSKKRFNKFSLFYRFILFKLIKTGNISGFQKLSW